MELNQRVQVKVGKLSARGEECGDLLTYLWKDTPKQWTTNSKPTSNTSKTDMMMEGICITHQG